MLLKACLNGVRRPADHPALPVTAAQLADDAVRVAAAGAGAVHVHPKDAAGADTLAAPAVAEVVTAIRAAAPGLPVGVTTGAWARPDPAERVAEIRSWTVRPDFASVNWHEPGADDVAAALLELGVAVEAGLWTAAAVGAWLASPHRARCLRVLLELQDGDDPADAGRLLGLLPPGAPVLLHGEGSSCWPVLRLAVDQGLDTRIGLEDTLVLPDGSPAPGNEALVRAARALVDAAVRRSVGGDD
ncbi:3-keto-5-aminohexanoate cleavage protein [Geodermatophilus sp. SYSU D00815]